MSTAATRRAERVTGQPAIAVIGAGLMGHGIAYLFADRGFRVALHEPAASARDTVPQRIADICTLLETDPASIDRITLHAELGPAVSDADLVIEAVPEKPALKQDLFAELVRHCRADAILATNSSVIPVGTVASRLDDIDAGRVIGTHFWNPPYLIPLVEVIQSARSNPLAIQRAMTILRDAGKTPVHVQRDVVIGNRLQHALWREAMAAVEQGICSADTIDTVVKNTIGLRLAVLGPLENADLVGLGLSEDIHRVVLPQLDNSTEPLAILRAKVAAGELGMATGKGFHDWTPERCAAVRERLLRHLLTTIRDQPR